MIILFLKFGHLDFGFVSDFDIRIYELNILSMVLP